MALSGGAPVTDASLTSISARAWRVLAIGSLCNFVTALNQSMMSVAFADLQRSFPNASSAELSWVLNSYTIVAGATLILSAVVCDRFGRKRMLLTGVSVFSLAAAVCALAPNPPALIAARVVQALGWSLITPSAISVVLSEIPVSRRATAVASWSGIGGIATALGPSVGAVLVDAGTWRWAFWISVPIAAVVIPLGARTFRETPRHELVKGDLPDPIGALALMGGLTLWILGLVQSPRWGWLDGGTIGCLVVGALLIAFLLWRSARVSNPMLKRKLLQYRNMRLSALMSIGFGTGFFSMSLGLVLFLHQVWGYSIVRSGVLVTPIASMVSVLSPIAGRLADRFGHLVLAVPAGISWCTGSLWLLVLADGTPDLARVWFPAMFFLGIGSGFAWPTIHGIPVIGIPTHELGSAVASNQTVLRVSGALGVAIAVTLISDESGAGALDAFHPLFILMAVTGLSVSVIGLWIRTGPQARLRADHPELVLAAQHPE
jgi:EmrB/QacA subfamily drug resistance transporter